MIVVEKLARETPSSSCTMKWLLKEGTIGQAHSVVVPSYREVEVSKAIVELNKSSTVRKRNRSLIRCDVHEFELEFPNENALNFV